MRRLSFLVASFAVATTMAVGSAGAARASSAPIRPGQIFNGFVNGKLRDATIRMACAGPVRPGQLGHPAAGQTLEVQRSLDVQPSGYMGGAYRVSVDLSLRLPIPHTVHLADFAVYGTRALPTWIQVPCAGDGQVVFSPFHGGASARSQSVHVMFMGQP